MTTNSQPALLSLVGEVDMGGMAFEQLSRRHAIKIPVNLDISVEECSLAIGAIVGYDSVVSASRMNGSVVIFLDSTDKVSKVVATGVVINENLINVLPLVTPSKRVILSNVPPFISDEIISRELARYGQVVSSIKMIPFGCKSPLLKHVVSFRRQFHMILKDYTSDLNVAFKFKVDRFYYTVFASTETMKCFQCGREGHLIRACPEKKQNGPTEGSLVSGANEVVLLETGVGEENEVSASELSDEQNHAESNQNQGDIALNRGESQQIDVEGKSVLGDGVSAMSDISLTPQPLFSESKNADDEFKGDGKTAFEVAEGVLVDLDD